jgi:hypothetical protein
MGDIVERLLNAAGEIFPGRFMSFDGPLLTEAADEIQRLRVALALACNELFGTCDPLKTSPHELMTHFLEEARDG